MAADQARPALDLRALRMETAVKITIRNRSIGNHETVLRMSTVMSVTDLKKKYVELGGDRLKKYQWKDIHLSKEDDTELDNDAVLLKYQIRQGSVLKAWIVPLFTVIVVPTFGRKIRCVLEATNERTFRQIKEDFIEKKYGTQNLRNWAPDDFTFMYRRIVLKDSDILGSIWHSKVVVFHAMYTHRGYACTRAPVVVETPSVTQMTDEEWDAIQDNGILPESVVPLPGGGWDGFPNPNTYSSAPNLNHVHEAYGAPPVEENEVPSYDDFDDADYDPDTGDGDSRAVSQS